MKKSVLFVILLLGLFLIACSTQESRLKSEPGVKLFYAMNDDVKYSETSFSGEAAKAVSELVKTECPNGLGEKFTRSTFAAYALTLNVYSTDKNVTCYVTRLNNVSNVIERKKSDAPSEDALVTVNGNIISKTALQNAVSALPAGTTVDLNTELRLLNTLVDKELLREQEAKIELSADDIAKVRKTILVQLNVSEEGLPAFLEKQKIDKATFETQIESQARLEKLLSKRLLTDEIQVSEDDARAYYLANTNQFMFSERAVFSHILLKGKPNEYAAKVQEIESKLNNTDFCVLVKKYSDDTSRMEQCGTYEIPRDVIDSTLERAAFTTPVNNVTKVVTADGVHFVKTLQVTKAQVLPYSEVADKLRVDLKNLNLQQRLNLYLATLRAQSKIETFLG